MLMLMAKSRHKKPENVRRYFKPTHEAISELTILFPPRRRAALSRLPGRKPGAEAARPRRRRCGRAEMQPDM